MKQFFSVVVSFILISQLVVAPRYLYAQETGLRHKLVPTKIESKPDLDIGFLTKQYRVDFEYVNGQRVEAKKTPLSQLEVNLEKPPIVSPQKELRYEYKSDTKELWIIYSTYNKKEKIYEDRCAHVLEDIDLTSNIALDSNMIAFATPQGIRLTLIERIVSTGFVEPVFVPLISPKAYESKDKSFKISSLRFLNTQDSLIPEVFKESMDQKIYAGDLLVSQSSDDGTVFHSFIDRSSIILTLRNQLIGLLFMCSFYVNREEQQELLGGIEQILSSETSTINEYFQSAKKVFSDASSQDLILNTLKNIAAGDSLKSLKSLLSTTEGSQVSSDDVLTLYTKVDRKSFTPSDVESISKLVEEYKIKTKKESLTPEEYQQIELYYFRTKIKDSISSFPDLDKNLSSFIEKLEQEEPIPWSQKVEEYSKEIDSTVQEGILQKKSIKTKMFENTKRIWSLLTKKYKKITTSISIATLGVAAYSCLKSMGVHAGIDQINYLFESLIAAIRYSKDVPLIGSVVSPIYDLGAYLKNSDMWTRSLFTGGLFLAVIMYPVSLLCAKILKPNSKLGVWQTFFNIGIKSYAILCYPLVKILWDAIGQKNIYPELARGFKPFFTKPGTFSDQIDKKAQAIAESYSEKQDITLLSKVIAASVVVALTSSKDKESMSIDKRLSEEYAEMIDVVQLLLKDPSTQLSYAAEILAESQDQSIFLNEIAAFVYDQLSSAKKKVEKLPLTKQRLLSDIQHYLDIRSKIIRDPSCIKQRSGLKKLFGSLGSFFSKGFVNYIFFGDKGLEVYKKYSNFSIDKNTSDIAGESYRNDFIASTIIYAGVDPLKFTLGNMGNWEIFANQTGQVFVFGIQGAIDPHSVAVSNIFSMPEEYKSIDSSMHSYKKVQGFGEAVKIAFTSSDVLSSQGYLDTHAQYIKNLANGFNARFVADFSTRVVGYMAHMFTSMGAAAGASLVGATLLRALFESPYFIIAKICVSPAFIGYAAFWPAINLSMKKIRTSADFYQDILSRVANLIDTSLMYSNLQDAQKAVLILKSLYYVSSKTPDPKYQKPVEEFSIQDAVSFNEYTKANLPVSVTPSWLLDKVATMAIGTVVSVILFDDFSSHLYDSDFTVIESLGLLGYSILALIGTYTGLKLSSAALKKLISLFSKKENATRSLISNMIEDPRVDEAKVDALIKVLYGSEDQTSLEPVNLTRKELYNLSMKVEKASDCKSLFFETKDTNQ